MAQWVLPLCPPDWKRSTLGDVSVSIQTGPFGSQLHAADYVEHGIPCIMPKDIRNGHIVEDSIARISQETADGLARHKVKSGDIIYSRRGDVEKCALVRPHQAGWICGTGCLKITLDSTVINPVFISYYLNHPAIKSWVVGHAVGATMPNLDSETSQAV
ncbi:MAG: hypothetical protein ABL867_07600 [Rickettsiales bacterium]